MPGRGRTAPPGAAGCSMWLFGRPPGGRGGPATAELLPGMIGMAATCVLACCAITPAATQAAQEELQAARATAAQPAAPAAADAAGEASPAPAAAARGSTGGGARGDGDGERDVEALERLASGLQADLAILQVGR